ncbi:MAG: MFS transporter [PS1 clade bacterium]|uniref:MFS transporter n=1 Tax=PS1 clade bacterium TaxID=2175152 RepID=A0A937HD23_9PROT|nr:MFS transporter [PS1 clade bacterium]
MSSFKLDNSIKFYYGLGAAPYGIKDNGFSYFLLIFYSQVLGLSPVLASLALTVAIIVDAVTDPLIGYVSDNWRSKWGRRHPFMYWSIIPICVSYGLMWNPPEAVLATQGTMFAFLVVMAVSIRIFLTFFEVPNTALISELTTDYDQRTGLMGLRFMFGWLGGIGMAFLGYSVFFQAADGSNGILQAEGYAHYGVAAACLMFVGMLASSLGTHKTIPHLHVPPHKDILSPRQIIGEVLDVMKNRNFMALFLASIFFGTASGFTAALSIYFSTFFWGLVPSQLAILTMLQAVAAICAVPLARRLSERFDKRRAALGSFLFILVWGPTMLIGRLLDIVPENGDPMLFPMLLAHNFTNLLAAIVFFIMFGSMMADVVEDSAVDTARRSEGIVFAARGFAGKMVTGLGIMMAGAVLSIIDLPRNAKPEDVDPDQLVDLVLFAAPLEAVFYIAAFFVFRRYRISRGKHNQNVEAVAGL